MMSIVNLIIRHAMCFKKADIFDKMVEAALSPLQSYTYSPCGDLLATHTYTNSTDIITETYSYLDWGKVSSAVNAAASLNAPVIRHPLEIIAGDFGYTIPVEAPAMKRTVLSF